MCLKYNSIQFLIVTLNSVDEKSCTFSWMKELLTFWHYLFTGGESLCFSLTVCSLPSFIWENESVNSARSHFRIIVLLAA